MKKNINLILTILCLLFLGYNSFASIVYTDITDTQMPTNGASFDVNMDNSGGIEFSFNNMMNRPYIVFNPNNHIATFSDISTGQGWDVIKGFTNGSSINTNSGYYDQGDAFIAPTFANYYTFPINTDTYLACQFNIGNTTFYGWIRVFWNGANLTFKDYAYENTANSPINAGDIGNPILVSSISVAGFGNLSNINTNGGTLQMSATVLPINATNGSFTWSVANGTGSASINSSGLLTAISNGLVTVLASANDGSGKIGTKIISISNQVSPIVLLNTITVTGAGNASTISTNGGTLQMSSTVLPANATNTTYTWSVINGTGSASINSTGLLTAISNGTVIVKATANDASGVIGTKLITISNQVTQTVLVSSITVNAQGNNNVISTNAGNLQMLATILPLNATNQNISWSIVNASGVATIDVNGLITALTDGVITVKATALDGSNIFGTSQVFITNQIILASSLTVIGQNNISTINTDNGTLQMLASFSPINTSNQNVSWQILSGNNFASINSTGLVTAISNGVVTIKATALDGSNIFGTKDITINNQINGMNELEINNPKITIFPNPISDIANIVSSEFEFNHIVIIDYLGQTLIDQKFDRTNANNIDLSVLNSGCYLISIYLEDEMLLNSKISKL